MNDSRLVEELGKTQTVKDVQAAYEAIFEAKRQLAVRMKHARQDREKLNAEIETFLDDLKDITGLPMESPLFTTIARLIIAKRLARRKLAHDTTSEDWFPKGW